MQKEVYILSAVRTALGTFGGAFAGISATKLGAAAIKGAVEKAGINPEEVNEVFMGNVLSANLGQAPARQAALFAGLPQHVDCTTVNKVCASGSKAVMLAAQTILTGDNDLVIAGGMENMSMVPYYLENGRYGYKYGNGTIFDGLVKDGLTDVYNGQLMGVCAELCAKEYQITREQQDAYAIQSYQRTAASMDKLAAEKVPVMIPQKKGDAIAFLTDEEYTKVDFSKIPTLRTVFQNDGTVTAANASTINDGAAAIVLASGEYVRKHNLKPIARIVSYADAAQAPEWFTTAPSKAIPKALEKAGLKSNDIDFFELNEAFSVVALANNKILGLDENKVNVYGGAVSLGHPLGASGARIIVTLLNVLHQEGGKYGATGICNGGGAASSLIFEAL
ncbi:MAG: acetyl-CoA C-acyltransferase [Bacteroidia bacterium]|nr:acetyl-CoA C-acyltransferase [Bacteroidia bacterium]